MKAGFWAALVIGILGLADILFSPLLGAVQALFFLAAAWGIRRGRPWAAIAALAMVVAPVVALLLQMTGAAGARVGSFGLVMAMLLTAAAAVLLARAAVLLFRRRGQGFLRPADVPIAVYVLLVFAACFSIRPYGMPTDSMAQTLLKGDYLLVDVASPALGWHPAHNDLLVFRLPNDHRQTFVKRVVGVPGDRIRLTGKQLIRNGAPVDEPWAVHLTSYTDPYRDNFPAEPNTKLSPTAEAMLAGSVVGGEVVVPKGMLFVMGDNRDSSLDSRYFGFVPRANVAGRPVMIYASFEDGTAPSPRRARWNRVFHLL